MKKSQDDLNDLIKEQSPDLKISYLAKIPEEKFRALEIIRDRYNESQIEARHLSINKLINIAINLLLEKNPQSVELARGEK